MKRDKHRREAVRQRKKEGYRRKQEALMNTDVLLRSEPGMALFRTVGLTMTPIAAEYILTHAHRLSRKAGDNPNKIVARVIVGAGEDVIKKCIMVAWHTILSHIGTNTDTVSGRLGTRIGDAVLKEIWLNRVKDEHPREYQEFIKAEAGYKNLRRTWAYFERHFENKYGIKVDKVHEENNVRSLIGLTFLYTILKCTDLIEGEYQMRRRGSMVTRPLIIRPSEKLKDRLKDLANYVADQVTAGYGYVTEPPEDWTGPEDGGYAERGMYIVRGARAGDVMPEPDKAPEVYTALNRLQQVQYELDEDMLKLAEYIKTSGSIMMNFPNPERVHVQPLVVGEEWDRMNDQEKKLTGLKRRIDLKTWEESVGNRTFLTRIIAEAADIQRHGGDCFFPASCDFRGRIYQGSFLGPQGCDLARSLIQFKSKEIVERPDSFLDEGARRYGTWDLNQQQALALGKLIREGDPVKVFLSEEFASLKVEECSDPWQFLQWCRDYYLSKQGEPVGTIASVDASCNGLQIWSLLLKDAQLAAKVNVVWNGGGKQDIYTEYAENLSYTLNREGTRSCRTFSRVGISRELAKSIVMKIPYGLSVVPITETLHEYLLDTHSLPDISFFPDAKNITGLVYNLVQNLVPGAIKAQKWLKKVATPMAKTGVLTWTTPVGFPVHIKRVKYKARKLDLLSLGFQARVTVKSPTPEPHPAMLKRSLPANYIHSLDGAVATRVAAKWTMPQLRLIHDSFGTHPNHLEALVPLVLRTYAEMFKDNLLEKFASQVQPGYAGNLPDMGELDVERVLDSPYFLS